MHIQVRLFAMMAQQARTGMLTLELPEGTAVATVQPELQRRHPKMPWPQGTLLAVNQEYASGETVLKAGDEVAIIPPVSGGWDMQ
jgi:molybdopterin synthase catalytic subunit